MDKPLIILSLILGTLGLGRAYNVKKDVQFKTAYFPQVIDHFNFKSYGNVTFKQRYLFTDEFWDGKGPVFFYTGNEGPIIGFQKASGFLTDYAPHFKALVVFAEHRYYGTSLPFGQASFDGDKIGFLSVDQALADFATLIQELKIKFKAQNSKVVAFGGSYGGMLSAFMRFKYPNLIDGAFAASCPLYWTSGHGDRHEFFHSVTEQFGKSNKSCVERVKEGFTTIANLAKLGRYEEISTIFRLCNQVNSSSLNHLYGWVRNSFTNLAMMNYPYPTDLLAPLPGFPVNAACKEILDAPNAITGLAKGAAIFYEGIPSRLSAPKCFDIYNLYIECADPTGCGLGNDAKAWDYQACTDIILPGGSTNVTDMFPKLPFTLEMRNDYCKKKYGVVARNTWPDTEWWGTKISTAHNIIYSNGDLDPWSGGGVHHNMTGITAIEIKTGAHHYDLRGSNPKDTEEIINVRNQEASIISKWLEG